MFGVPRPFHKDEGNLPLEWRVQLSCKVAARSQPAVSNGHYLSLLTPADRVYVDFMDCNYSNLYQTVIWHKRKMLTDINTHCHGPGRNPASSRQNAQMLTATLGPVCPRAQATASRSHLRCYPRCSSAVGWAFHNSSFVSLSNKVCAESGK